MDSSRLTVSASISFAPAVANSASASGSAGSSIAVTEKTGGLAPRRCGFAGAHPLMLTGNCWCGRGNEVGLGSFFSQGHDKIAEAALLEARYDNCELQLPWCPRQHPRPPQESPAPGTNLTKPERGHVVDLPPLGRGMTPAAEDCRMRLARCRA
jgi:hypothetical protein